MKYDDSTLDRILNANSLRPYCEALGWSFKEVGGEHHAPCPFHLDGERPNFRVNDDKQTWFCDVCGEGGDVFKLVMRMDKLTFPRAVEKLASRAGIVLHGNSSAASRSAKIVATYDYTDETGKLLPEFGRLPDVQRLYGLKRGFVYQLIAAGKIKSVSLRKPGSKFGCRLIHLQSVRDFLNANLQTGDSVKKDAK